MRKILFRIVMTFALLFTMSLGHAQTAIQTSKFFDNTSIGVHAGVTGPIKFNEVFPLNSMFGITVGKQITPVIGINIEGSTWLGSNADKVDRSRFDSYIGHNVFRAVNVGANGTLNLSNLFNGYEGKPRVFEVGLEGGIGWLHMLQPNTNNRNALSAKTQANFMFNLGSKKAHTIAVSPTIWWNLTGEGLDHAVKFNRHNAQIGVVLSYTYHFKTSAGTHYFKTYDVGALQDAIAALEAENAKLREAGNKTEIVERTTVDTAYVEVPLTTVVYFALNDATLDDAGKAELDKIPAGCAVNIIGTASPEGSEARNLELSKMRANVTADYLNARGVKVMSAEGKGVATGSTSNRVAIVKLALLEK